MKWNENGDVRLWRPPFHASPVVHKGPISSKSVSLQDPLLRKFGNFSLYSLNFHPNFSSQAPKFGNFQLTSPQIWKFSVHKPPNLEIFSSQAPPFHRQISVHKPHFRNLGCTPLPEKKVECPPPGFNQSWIPGAVRWSLDRGGSTEYVPKEIQGILWQKMCSPFIWVSQWGRHLLWGWAGGDEYGIVSMCPCNRILMQRTKNCNSSWKWIV